MGCTLHGQVVANSSEYPFVGSVRPLLDFREGRAGGYWWRLVARCEREAGHAVAGWKFAPSPGTQKLT